MSSSMYYEFRNAKVVIAAELRKRGWQIFGYHEDNSDPMTDYYDPAYWDGIATKNGYIVNIDCPTYKSGQEDYLQSNHSSEETLNERDLKRLKALREVRQDRGASAEEERSAIEKIALIEAKRRSNKKSICKVYFPTFQENPGRCSWHVEKDGKIVAKGTGIAKFSCLRFASRNNDGSYRAEEYNKLWQKLDTLVNKIDSAAGSTIGSEDYDYQTVTEIKYKHKNIIARNSNKTMEEGAYFVLNGFLGYDRNMGYVYKLHRKNEKTWYAIRMNSALTKERTGSQRGVNFGYIIDGVNLDWFKKLIELGTIEFCDIVDEAKPYEVQKVVKRKKKVI